MTNGENGHRDDLETNILDFVLALRKRKHDAVAQKMLPFAECLSRFAQAFGDMHRYNTQCGANFADIVKELLAAGVDPARIAAITVYVKAAQDAFANDIAQGAFEASIQHFNDATEALHEILEEKQ
jgi:hypothetical protein